MEAIVIEKYGDESVLELKKDHPIPKPGQKQVLVKIHAFGVNPVETYLRRGIYGDKNVPLPAILGKDGAGVIEEVGANSEWKKGERVYVAGGNGTYAQYCVANDSSVHSLPENISFEQGAAIGIPYATAYNALFQVINTNPKDIVLIHGASGGVGVAATEFCAQRGIKVIGTASTPEGIKLAKEKGCAEVFNHKEEGYTEKIVKYTEGKGPSVILEMLANVNLEKDLNMVSHLGKVVIIGSRGEANITPRNLMNKRSSVHGMSLFNATPDEFKEIHKAIFAGLRNKTLNPVVGKSYPLQDIQKVHHDIINSSALGKLVVLPWSHQK